MKHIVYEVWALGYDKDWMCTDVEVCLGTYETKEEAIEAADSYTIDGLVKDKKIPAFIDEEDGDIIQIVVETIDENEIIPTNIDTVFEKILVFSKDTFNIV